MKSIIVLNMLWYFTSL